MTSPEASSKRSRRRAPAVLVSLAGTVGLLAWALTRASGADAAQLLAAAHAGWARWVTAAPAGWARWVTAAHAASHAASAAAPLTANAADLAFAARAICTFGGSRAAAGSGGDAIFPPHEELWWLTELQRKTDEDARGQGARVQQKNQQTGNAD